MRYFILFLLWLLYWESSAQITFNKRVQLGCAQTVLTAIEATDSCYYITGVAKDTNDCSIGALFYKVDLQGNELAQRVYSLSNKLETWKGCLRTDVDGNLIVSGEIFDTGKVSALVIKYTPNGDTLWTRKYPDPGNPTGYFLRTDEFILAPDSSYLLAGQTNVVDTNSFVIMQIERDGRIRWHKNFGYDWNYCVRHSIVPLEDGFVMGYSNTDHNKRWIDYTTLCQIKKMDYNGNVLWEWQNDSSVQYLGANDLIQTKDKGWVVGTATGKEFLNTSGHTSRFAHDSYIFKLDSARNWLWGTQLRGYSYSNYSKVMKVVEQPDSSLLTFGITADTITMNGTLSGRYNLLVARLSPNGDSLWSHQYYYTDQAWATHEIFDVEQTSDGGYLIAGQAKLSGQGVSQQGWLLKLDQNGCLVPGCHLPDTTTSILPITSQPQAQLKLYPNPAVDYLNVLYRNKQLGEKLTFRILDQQGRVLQSYTARDISDKTYLFPVWELLGGWYVLEVRQDEKLVGSEVFVKE